MIIATCPNDCSGNGICSSIGDVSYYLGPSYDNKNILYGYGEGPIYDNWDKNAIQMCECSRGYFGADCSLSNHIYYLYNILYIYI